MSISIERIRVNEGYLEGLSERYDKVYLIVRSIGKRNLLVRDNIIHKPELSPSWNLFKAYREIDDKGLFDEKWFNEHYVPVFIREMLLQRNTLNELYEMGKHENIALVCYCEHENLCHRSILMGLLQGADKYQLSRDRADTNVAKHDVDYSHYYDLYSKLRFNMKGV